MSIRYFTFWCATCPTRISLETEVPAGAAEDRPTYDFAESEWIGRCAMGHVANRCPACRGPLHDVDDLVAREFLPVGGWADADESALHVQVRSALAGPVDAPRPHPWSGRP